MRSRRVGLIGLGYWGSKYLRLLRELPGIELAFVVDLDSNRFDELGIPRSVPTYGELKKALGENEEATDGVIVATPASSHKDVVQDCLEGGLNVMVEKPLALSSEDALFLAMLSRKLRRVLFPGHIYAHNDAVKKLHSYVQDGSLGKIRYASCSRMGLGPIRGDVNVLWDLVPHDLTILDMIDLLNPKLVATVGTSFVQPGIEDVAFGTLLYPNGSLAHIQTSWLDPHKVRKVTVVGSKRMAIFDDVATEDRLRIYERGADVLPTSEYGEFRAQIHSGDIHVPFIPAREPLRNMVEVFLNACNSLTFPEQEIAQALRIVAVLEAMGNSMRSDGSITKVDWKVVEKYNEATVVG